MVSPSSGQTGHCSPVAAASGVGEGEPPSVRAYRIPDVCKATGLGRTSVYAAIKSGELVARKWNRCTIVLGDDLATFLNNLPKVG
jgi:Helix-turn-helix domain